jgi:hypothetical protein
LRPWRPRRLPPPALACFAAVSIMGMGACAEAFRSGSPNPGVLQQRADGLFEAAEARFSPNELSPRYEAVRLRLAQGALIPSRVFDDTTLWDARPSATRREIFVQGGMVADGRYRLEQRPALSAPVRPGDTRHLIGLDRLGDNTYRWNTRVDLAIGSMTAEEASDAFLALLVSASNREERALREDYRAAFPRSMSAFGMGFTLDSARMIPGALGTTAVAMTFSFRPDLMRASYPALAGYVDKYLGPAKYHLVLAERGGGVVFDVVGRDRSLTVRYRVQQGKLVSLLGPPKPWSDSLQLTADVSLKVKHLTVGFHHLVAEFTIAGSGHDRAWTIVAQHEPDWDLPLITERLIRSPLRRPFEGAGAMFRIGVRDGPTDGASGQSVFSRSARLDVQESAIMHFLGSLASHAVGDIDTRVETDEHRFLHDGFAALRADLRGLKVSRDD